MIQFHTKLVIKKKKKNTDPINSSPKASVPAGLEALVELLDPDDESGDGVEEPVEDEGGGDEEGVALALDDGFLVAEVLGGRARLRGLAAGACLVLPVDIHQKKQTEGHHREEWLQKVPSHRDQPLPEPVQPRNSKQQHHDRLRRRGVPQHHPLQCHFL
jgi:hypothetical protein